MNFGKEDLINGNITGAMLRFAFPLMLGNLLQQCYNIADTLIVGRVLGADALAAVGSSYALIVFVTSVFIGLCMGCSAVFSMQYGSNDFKEMRRSIFSSIVLVGGVTLFLNVCSLVFLSPIIHILQTPPEVERMVHDYLLIIFLGMVPVCVYNFYAFPVTSPRISLPVVQSHAYHSPPGVRKPIITKSLSLWQTDGCF